MNSAVRLFTKILSSLGKWRGSNVKKGESQIQNKSIVFKHLHLIKGHM